MHRLPRRRLRRPWSWRQRRRRRRRLRPRRCPPPVPRKLPPISVGAWTRVGGMFQGSNPSQLGDWRMDNAYVELHAGGKIHEKVGVTLNLNANMISYTTTTPVGLNPLVAVDGRDHPFDLIDEFHVWAGRLLVPVDRANASGPFFMIPWNYPGFLSVGPTCSSPRRSRGPTAVTTAPSSGATSRAAGSPTWPACSTTPTSPRARCFRGACGSRSSIRNPGSGATAATSARRTSSPSAWAGSSRTTAARQ